MPMSVSNPWENMSQVSAPRVRKKISKEEMERLRQADHKKVKGVFRCFEPPGGMIKFSFKKYPGDQTTTYTMEDGKIYEVPLMVARHLNSNCFYPVHSHIMDAQGVPQVNVGKKIRRVAFESLDFMDGEDEQT